jgi:hypothetical protein
MVKERCSADSRPLLIFHQNICEGRKNSSFPKFPHVLRFSEHHLKQIELEEINLEVINAALFIKNTIIQLGISVNIAKNETFM